MRNGLAGWSQFALFCLLTLELAWFLTACAAPQKYKYTPSLRLSALERSEPLISKPIPVTVRMINLMDVSPADDKEDGWLYGSGWSATSTKRLGKDLSVLITEAIQREFRFREVFQTLVQEKQQEQMGVGGKIHRYYQRREQYLWNLCCGLLGMLFFPFPVMKEEGEVDLEVTLFRTDGSTIKSYRGKSSFLKRCGYYDKRCNEPYEPESNPIYLDQAFADSLYQIRRAIIQDSDLITRQVTEKENLNPSVADSQP